MSKAYMDSILCQVRFFKFLNRMGMRIQEFKGGFSVFVFSATQNKFCSVLFRAKMLDKELDERFLLLRKIIGYE